MKCKLPYSGILFLALIALFLLGFDGAFVSGQTIAEGEKGKHADTGVSVEVLRTTKEDRVGFNLLAASAEAQLLVYTEVSGFRPPFVCVYDLKKKKEVQRMDTPERGEPRFAAIAPNGTVAIGSLGYSAVHVLDPNSDKYRYLEYEYMVTSVISNDLVFTPDSKRLVSIGGKGDAEIHVWDVASGKKIRRFGATPLGPVRAFRLSEDGTYLLVEHWLLVKDGVIEMEKVFQYRISLVVWDLASGKLISRIGEEREFVFRFRHDTDPSPNLLEEFIGPAQSFHLRLMPNKKTFVFPRFAGNGDLVAAWCKTPDDLVCLSDIANKKELVRLPFRLYHSTVILSKDGRSLFASGFHNKSIAICALDVSEWQRRARTTLPKDEEVDAAWAGLQKAKPVDACRAVVLMARAPKKGLSLVKASLNGLLMAGTDPDSDTRRIQQGLWAIELCARIDSSDSRQLLRMIAKAKTDDGLSQEAAATLKSLEQMK